MTEPNPNATVDGLIEQAKVSLLANRTHGNRVTPTIRIVVRGEKYTVSAWLNGDHLQASDSNLWWALYHFVKWIPDSPNLARVRARA